MLPPLLIGLTVAVAHLFLIPITGEKIIFVEKYFILVVAGTSINPARSFGVSVIKGSFPDHWVFWLGPIVGGALGGVLYRFVFFNNDDDFD